MLHPVSIFRYLLWAGGEQSPGKTSSAGGEAARPPVRTREASL